RWGQGLSGQHLRPVRRVVDERGKHGRRLKQVAGRGVVEGVQVRVMGTRVIVQWVLDELKTRETYRVEREMVSSLRAAVGEGGDAEIPERRHPRLEDRSHHSITLEIDPADPSRAVIQVEVAGELRMLRLGLHRHRVGEVLADVAPGAEQALLLAAPE